MVLDTHSVLWYLEGSLELSAAAREKIESAISEGRDVHVSAISLIEIIYLVERRKIPEEALARFRNAVNDPSSGLSIAPVNAGIANTIEKIPRNIVPDMPDRIIAATALHLGVPLVTRDRRLQSASIQTIW